MSRGGRWKTDAPVSALGGPTPKRGRWQSRPPTAPLTALDLTPERSDLEEKETFEDWALRHILGGTDENVPAELTLDLSCFDEDEKAAMGILLQQLFVDGPQEDQARWRDRKRYAISRVAKAWSADVLRWRLQRCFFKILDVMSDVIATSEGSNHTRLAKGEDTFASTLASFVFEIQKRLEKRKDVITGEVALAPFWDSKLFQEKLQSMRKHKASDHPKRRFAKFICDVVIGPRYIEAKLNDRELVIDGITWKWPKTPEDFKEMRPVLQWESVRHFNDYAGILDEDGLTGQAEVVRALKTSQKRHRFYHQAQFDEAFRSHLGLSKPRKTKAKKAAKPAKKKAKRVG